MDTTPTPYPMSRLEAMFLWLSGYHPSTLAVYPMHQREPITKLGVCVGIATLIATGSWGLAGYSYSDGSIPVAMLLGLVGAGIVLTFDRITLYFADTTLDGKVSIPVWITRIALITAISSVTSLALNSVILKSELEQHAQSLRDQSLVKRRKTTGEAYDLAARQVRLEKSEDRVKRVESDLQQTPADVKRLQDQARQALDRLTQERSRLELNGKTLEEAREATATLAERYRALASDAANRLAAYRAKKTKELQAASQEEEEARGQFKEAREKVSTIVEQGKGVDNQSINRFNAKVLASLIRSDTGAMIKWLITTLGLFILELLPFIIKTTMVNQSIPGRDLAKENHEDMIRKREEAIQLESDHRQFNELLSASKEMSGWRSERMRKMLQEHQEKYFVIHAPLLGAMDSMKQIMRHQTDFDRLLRGSGSMAQAFTVIWGDAVRQVNNILRSFRTDP